MNTVNSSLQDREIIAARISLYSGILFTAQLILLHIIEPEYNSSWHFISEYMLGKFGWLMNTAFLCLSVSMAAAGFAILSQLQKWYGYLGVGILGLAAVGICIAGFFTTDPVSYGVESKTTFSGTMHIIGASLDYTPIAAILISLDLAKNSIWQAIRRRLFITSCLTLVLMFLFIAVLPFDGKLNQDSVAGHAGRALIFSYVVWLLSVDLHIIRNSPITAYSKKTGSTLLYRDTP